MRHGIFSFITASIILLISSSTVFAESGYVLPYPSDMPGSKFYKVQQVVESLQKYWYFGNFGQFAYNLKLSDKYLVEAKTLFEYKQYLLGSNALKKSDKYFLQIPLFLDRAKSEGKNTSEKEQLLLEAREKHKEVLLLMKSLVPEKFVWIPEKDLPESLMLHDLIDASIDIRQDI